MAKATKKQVHPLHKPVKNEHALMALFMALAVFFFTYSSAVQGERAAASVTDQVIVAH